MHIVIPLNHDVRFFGNAYNRLHIESVEISLYLLVQVLHLFYYVTIAQAFVHIEPFEYIKSRTVDSVDTKYLIYF